MSGCDGGSAEIADPLSCFPEEARRWIPLVDDEGRSRPPLPQPTNATIYVDRSGSMVGYLAGATAAERPFHDLIGNLPAMLRRQQARPQFKAFGTRISGVLSAQQQAALMGADFYRCARPGSPECDNSETRLDNVFREIASSRNGMALVVTDLWFSNTDIETSALSALAEPLTEILASGRAVAVYGLAAPFAGAIYDLPSEPATVRFQGEHPLFLIAVGSDAELAEFHRGWQRSPSPYLKQELESGGIRRTLFTLQPTARDAIRVGPLDPGTDPRIGLNPTEVFENVVIQQFQTSRRRALRIPDNPGAPPSWEGPTAQAFIPDSVWRGRYGSRVRIWDRRGRTCTEGDWLEGQPVPGLWGAVEGGRHRFSLTPDLLVTEIGREGTYLIVAELEREELETPSPQSAWMREWGFAPNDASPQRGGAGGVPLFRTLHLQEFARLLENALADAAERNNTPLFGFAVLVRIED